MRVRTRGCPGERVRLRWERVRREMFAPDFEHPTLDTRQPLLTGNLNSSAISLPPWYPASHADLSFPRSGYCRTPEGAYPCGEPGLPYIRFATTAIFFAVRSELVAQFLCLPGIRRATQTCDFLDLYAVKHRYGSATPATNLGCSISALPPQRPLLQQGADALSALRIFAGVRDFRIFSHYNDGGPVVVAANFLCLYAHQRILPHPLNLPSQR